MSGLIENIRVFIRAVESGSLSEAGRGMRISAAVASYRIRVLEKHLGCRLLIRTTRQMNLTEAGRSFYERALEVVEALERAEASVAEGGGSPRGVIKLTAPLGLGRRIVAPLIGEFRANHPETELRLRLSDHLLDFVKESIDIALRVAQLDDSTLLQRKVIEAKRVICAAPAYLDARGAPETLDDLLRHDCLLLRFPGSTQFRWPFGSRSKMVTVPVSGPMDADDGDVLTDWALAGLGLVMKPTFEVARHIADGRLRVVMPAHPPQPVSVALLYPSRKMQPRRERDLIEIMHAAVKKHLAEELALIDKKI